jgi:hypothetical protein
MEGNAERCIKAMAAVPVCPLNNRAAAAVIENVQHFRKAVDGFFGSAIGDQLTLGANSATNEVSPPTPCSVYALSTSLAVEVV